VALLQFLEDHRVQALIGVETEARPRQVVEGRVVLRQIVEHAGGDDVGHGRRQLLGGGLVDGTLWLDDLQQAVLPEPGDQRRIDLVRLVSHVAGNEQGDAIEEQHEVLDPVAVIPDGVRIVERELARGVRGRFAHGRRMKVARARSKSGVARRLIYT
jgi:hypothetical protein